MRDIETLGRPATNSRAFAGDGGNKILVIREYLQIQKRTAEVPDRTKSHVESIAFNLGH